MGYVVLGVAVAAAATDPAARSLALDGAVLQMVSHGVVTGVLFLLVGMLQERAHTREMGEFGGLLRIMPALGWAFVLAAFASLGLPGLAHFPAEFQIFLGTFYVYPMAVAATLGIVVTAGLYLRTIQIAFLGEPKGEWTGMKDLNGREVLAAAPLLALAVLIGVAPLLLLDVIHATTEALLP
jgi:NADH-quinone oxidoreductase subunit M